MKAATFQQICLERWKFSPVRKITHVENPKSWFWISYVMSRCVSVSLLYLLVPAIPALEICCDVLHFIQPRRFPKQMVKVSHKGTCTSPFCILWIDSQLSKWQTLFCQHLSCKVLKTFLILPCASKSRCSTILEELEIWKGLVRCSGLFPRCNDAQGKTPDLSSGKAEMEPLQKAGLLGFWCGAVVTDGRLLKRPLIYTRNNVDWGCRFSMMSISTY